MRRHFSRKWVPWAAPLLAVSLGVGLSLYLVLTSISDLEASNRWVIHTHNVIEETDYVWSTLIEAESGVRGFEINGDEVFLDHFKTAPDHISVGIQGLKDLVQDNAEQERNVADLQFAAKTKIDRLQLAVVVRRSSGFPTAQQLGRGKEGLDDMERVRAIIGRIVDRENVLLNARMLDAARSGQSSTKTVIASVLALAALILGAILAAVAFARSSSRFAELVSSIGDGFYSLDRSLRFIHFNKRAGELLGVEPSSVLGKALFDVFPQKRGTEMEEHFRLVIETKKPLVFCSSPLSDEHTIEYRVYPSVEGISVFLHDITDRLRAEAEIRKLNESLEQRVLDRTAQLDGFCHSIAHDMRTHIRGVSTNVALLAEDIQHGDTNLASRIQRLNQSTQHMASLVDGLLALARSSSKPVVRGEIDLSIEVKAIADRIRIDEEYAADAQFIIQPNIELSADRNLATVVLYNLVDNACKYRRAGVQPIVEIGEVEYQGQTVLFVRDNGIGFDNRYADQIFKPFERLHGNLSIPGSGIGLANAQRILERHGGRIWAESRLGEGSTFYFSFREIDTVKTPHNTDSVSAAHARR